MKDSKRKLLRSAAILAVATTAVPVHAQVEQIIVTAQTRDELAQDVPISLQVVSGSDLQENQIGNLQVLADTLPNVFISMDTVSNNLYIRGVGSGHNAGYEQAVSTFVDGVYHGRSRSTQSALVDIERIEVLRGPQTIYFGNNAIGGAFSVVTARPNLDNWEGYIQGSYEFVGNEPVLQAAVGGPIVEDRLAVRIAVYYSDLDGWIENDSTGEDNPAVEDRFVRFSSLLQISQDWSASFRAEYQDQDSVAPLAVQLTSCPPQPPFSAATTFSCNYALAVGQETDFDYHRSSMDGERGEIEAQEYSFRIERDNADGIGIMAQASYSTSDYLIAADTDGVDANFVSYNMLEYLDQTTLELRLTSPADSRVEYILGAYYLDSEADISTTLNFPFATVLLGGPLAPLAPFAPLTGTINLRQQEEAVSVFGSLTYPITDQFSATVGLRYTHSDKEAVQTATNATMNDPFGFSVTPLPAPLQPVAAFLTGFIDHNTMATVTDDAFLPVVTLRYEFNDDISVYAKYSEGFKAGGFDAVELTGVADRLTFEPETVDAFEIGLRALLADRTLRINLSAFRSDYNDLQQSVVQFTATSAFISVTNVGGLRTQGLEAELLWQPDDRFRLDANFALLDAEYQNYANAGCTALQAFQATQSGATECFQDLTGEAPPFSPSYSGNIRASYNFPIGNSLTFTAEAGMSFSGAYHVTEDLDPHGRQDAWQKFDLRFALSDVDERWSLALVGRNLTDERVLGSSSDVIASDGSYTDTILRGRTLAIQARFAFD
jgi:outer membrane receptor protein involved in Fe transport